MTVVQTSFPDLVLWGITCDILDY